MLERKLAEIVARLLIAIDAAPDDRINLDFAVDLLEGIAGELKSLDAHEQRAFVRLLDEVAEGSGDPTMAASIRAQAEYLGLEGSDDIG